MPVSARRVFLATPAFRLVALSPDLTVREGFGLFDEVVALPFGVGTDSLFAVVLRLLRGSSLRLASDQVGVRGEVLHAVAFEVRQRSRTCASP